MHIYDFNGIHDPNVSERFNGYILWEGKLNRTTEMVAMGHIDSKLPYEAGKSAAVSKQNAYVYVFIKLNANSRHSALLNILQWQYNYRT